LLIFEFPLLKNSKDIISPNPNAQTAMPYDLLIFHQLYAQFQGIDLPKSKSILILKYIFFYFNS